MAERIPDLWRLKEDVERLYMRYLNRLQMNHLHENVVSACCQIRRYASRGPGLKAGLFTFSFEIDSLCDLKDYQAAWRQLRMRERVIYGERLDLAHREWSATDGPELAFAYAPLLFFLGRHRQGCRLLETALGFWFRGRKARSYDVLFHVYNGDEQPCNRCRVTLSHFYDRLGKGLREWQHWEAFINGFHSRLFRLARVRRQELLDDSRGLAVFFDRLMRIRDDRTTSGVTWGQRDLIESPTNVRRRQDAVQEELEKFRERIKPTHERITTRLQELFPELRGLSR
jgi:hypothetical protein